MLIRALSLRAGSSQPCRVSESDKVVTGCAKRCYPWKSSKEKGKHNFANQFELHFEMKSPELTKQHWTQQDLVGGLGRVCSLGDFGSSCFHPYFQIPKF